MEIMVRDQKIVFFSFFAEPAGHAADWAWALGAGHTGAGGQCKDAVYTQALVLTGRHQQ